MENLSIYNKGNLIYRPAMEEQDTSNCLVGKTLLHEYGKRDEATLDE